MAEITWQPAHRRPGNAAIIEAEIRRVAQGGVVRLTLLEGGWRVRALLPAAMCGRGAKASERDASARVEEILLDHECPVAEPR